MTLTSLLVSMSIAAIITPSILQLSVMPMLTASRSNKQQEIEAQAFALAIKGEKVMSLSQVQAPEGCTVEQFDDGVGMAQCTTDFGKKQLVAKEAFRIGSRIEDTPEAPVEEPKEEQPVCPPWMPNC